ncbi:MAG: hypothetical protein FWC95_03090 [Defluviitaleaceae bacterium]|nr:hypothetical protein [Defluviitaleaceae bacterium]
MTNLEKIKDFIDKEGIPVVQMELEEGCAMVVKRAGLALIALDKSQINSPEEEYVVLLHEMGHCKENAMYTTHVAREEHKRKEFRADKWAYLYALPFEEIQKHVDSGLTSDEEIAEATGLTAGFVRNAVEYYALYGKCIQRNEWA